MFNRKISTIALLLLLGVGAFSFILPTHAETSPMIGAAGCGGTPCPTSTTETVTATIVNTSDILVVGCSVSSSTVGGTLTTSDGKGNSWTNQISLLNNGGEKSYVSLATATANGIGSDVFTCTSAGGGTVNSMAMEVYEMKGYTLSGLQTSSGSSDSSGGTASVSSTVVSVPSAIFIQVAGYQTFFPLTSTAPIAFIEETSQIPLAQNNAGAGAISEGYTGTNTFPIVNGQNNFWSYGFVEALLVLPQVSSVVTTTITNTVTTVTTTTRVGVIIQTTTQNGLPVISPPSLLVIIIITIIAIGLITAALFLSGLGRKGRR